MFEKLIITILGRRNADKLILILNRWVRKLSYSLHGAQQAIQWNTPTPPEWYDHYIDLHYYWKKKGIALWLERGIFNLLAMKQGARVLELCCGDGFNAYHFYSYRASSVVAVDFDPKAIEHAKENNQAKNIKFEVADIRTDMPKGIFDNILWDAAIEHFTADEIDSLMNEIKKRLNHEGILSGYTILEIEPGHGLIHHETEFKSKEDLMRFFTPYFKHVRVFETVYSSRHNLYFYASDNATLPFENNWPNSISQNKT